MLDSKREDDTASRRRQAAYQKQYTGPNSHAGPRGMDTLPILSEKGAPGRAPGPWIDKVPRFSHPFFCHASTQISLPYILGLIVEGWEPVLSTWTYMLPVVHDKRKDAEIAGVSFDAYCHRRLTFCVVGKLEIWETLRDGQNGYYRGVLMESEFRALHIMLYVS